MGCTQQKGGGQQSGYVNVDVADQGCSEVGFSGQINPSIGANAGLAFALKPAPDCALCRTLKITAAVVLFAIGARYLWGKVG